MKARPPDNPWRRPALIVLGVVLACVVACLLWAAVAGLLALPPWLGLPGGANVH